MGKQSFMTTKQLKFNDKLNEETKVFLRDEFLPILQKLGRTNSC